MVASPSATAERAAESTRASGRRRLLGSASARSTLLTVLGEFVHPRAKPVWTATLLDALACLAIEEKAARQALTRTATEGLLVSSRHGRRVLWDLTPEGRTLLEDGTRRIYGFMRERRPWDGEWLVVTVAIPETQRRLRHRLRTRLTWLGLGSPTSGLWISTDSSKGAEVAAVIRELGLDDQAFAWTGPASATGNESRLLSQAWDLEEVEERYLGFVDEFESRQVGSPREAFRAQVEMVEAWRRFPFLDPDLPAELLDHDWPGPRAASAFHDRHARWHRDARAAWDEFDAAGGPRP
jgi:phenylacetic acid degradation operon negative regulatory protein